MGPHLQFTTAWTGAIKFKCWESLDEVGGSIPPQAAKINNMSKKFNSNEGTTIFWKDGFEGEATGGYYFRAFDLNKFFKRLKADGKEVVALEFDDSNNVNVIIKK